MIFLILRLFISISLSNDCLDKDKLKQLQQDIRVIYKHPDIMYKRYDNDEKQKMKDNIHKDSNLKDILRIIP